MRMLLYKFPQNIFNCFSYKKLPWHIVAYILTYFFVTSGFDWYYFIHTQNRTLYTILFPAVALGGLMPIFLPFILLIIGTVRKQKKITITAWAVAQAAIIGSFISSVYKAFTGRIHPQFFDTTHDISHGFRFGILRGGIFWGWPSSHTTIAFAMSVTIVMLFPKKKVLGALVLIYALYIGLGVSISIHWFSEFTAGIFFGSIVGVIVGTSFKAQR